MVFLLGAEPPAALKPNCAVTSVAALCVALDRPLEEPGRRRLLEAALGPTASMAVVRRLAGLAGLAVEGYTATLDEVAALRGPAIVHLRESEHFVCVVGLDAEWAQLLDGWPPGFRVVPRAWLQDNFSGNCLLVPAAEADAKAAACSTVQRHRQFATAEAGRTVTHAFTVRNMGSAPLMLRASSSSCACATVGRSSFDVPPGASVEVPISLRVEPGAGSLEYIRLQTNDPRCPLIYLSIGVDRVPHNITWAPREVTLAGPPGPTPAVHVRVTGPPGFSFVAWSEPDLADVRISQHETDADKEVYILEVRAYGEHPSGRHEGRIVLDLRDEAGTKLAITITLVVPDIARPDPRRIADLRLKPGPYQRTIRLEPLLELPLIVAEAQVVDLPLQVADVERDDLGRWRIDLTGDLTPGIHRGRLVIRLESPVQPEIAIPITLQVLAP